MDLTSYLFIETRSMPRCANFQVMLRGSPAPAGFGGRLSDAAETAAALCYRADHR